jgi:hypothetical protein
MCSNDNPTRAATHHLVDLVTLRIGVKFDLKLFVMDNVMLALKSLTNKYEYLNLLAIRI